MPSKFVRSLDLMISISLLIVFFPIIFITYVCCLTETKSPIFKQKRIGLHEVDFTLFKFRTMSPSTPHVPTHEIHLSNVTPIGKVLRKYKLDELPQLLNVIKGDMSLVGPRPNLRTQIRLTSLRKKHNIYTVKPGITGLSQLRKIDMSSELKLIDSDKEMITNMTFWRYFAYIIMTAVGKGNGDHVKI